MKVHVWSDLHGDFWKGRWRAIPEIGKCDTLICAGDIGEIHNLSVRMDLEYLCSKYKQVFYLPGNHDDYNLEFGTAAKTLHAMQTKLANLTVLRTGEIHTLGEYNIIGDTGWIPDSLKVLKYPINDINLIKNIRPAIHEHHVAFKQFIYKTANSKTIVVSHHMPSWQTVAPQFTGDPYNCWFVGDCEQIIRDVKPYMWIFGHTHEPYIGQLFDTKLVCNPLGYPHENRKDMRGPLTVTI